MRALQRNRLARLVAAAMPSTAITWAGWRHGPDALAEGALDRDLANVQAAAGWLVGGGARLGLAVAGLPFRLVRRALMPRPA
jgi:hypothetical protein